MEKDIEIKLTSKQIKEMDELYADGQAIDQTLSIALNYHSNRFNIMVKKKKAWWDEINELNNLDKTKTWTIDSTGPYVLIKEKEKD